LPLPEIFSVIRRGVADQLPAGAPFCAVLDDSLLRWSGLHTHGVAWRRDPLGLRFQTNFVRAQRFLQVSAALPGNNGTHRLTPVALVHAPMPQKPKRNASSEAQAQYRRAASESRLGVRATQQISQLRQSLDQHEGGKQRTLLIPFDGGYTNSTVLKNTPPHTTCVGRIRKDAHLSFRPDPAQMKSCGRRLRYGADAPTPDELRTDDSQPWQTMTLQHSGVAHPLRYKLRKNIAVAHGRRRAASATDRHRVACLSSS
jgi:hypothetical protein